MTVYRNAFLSLNGTDVSAYLQSLETPISAEDLDDTAMGDTFRSHAAGLTVWSITGNFHQDFADNALDEILYTLFVAKAAFACIWRPDTGSVSTSNPQYSGQGVLLEYTPLTGSVGEQLIIPITIQAAGALSRTTA